jgi:hypothetical protein
MNLKLTSLTLGTILALGGGSLKAQDGKITKKWSVSGAVGLGTDNMKDVTNTAKWGPSTYVADVGYTGNFAATTIPFRVSLGFNMSPAGSAEKTYFERSMMGYQVAADLFIPSGIADSMQFFIGLSLNKWTINEKIEAEDFDGSHSIPGFKIGGRIGLEYKFSDALAFNATLQLAEIGLHDPVYEEPLDPKKEFGQRPLNASWFQFGVKFSF